MILDTIRTELNDFKKNNTEKRFDIVEVPYGGIYDDVNYEVVELDENNKPKHRVAEINVDDLIGHYKIKIEYRNQWYPKFKVYAEKIADALGKINNCSVTISNVIKKIGD
ncbi:MAG: hypothetical protein ISS95_00045 [Candidatus Aenigmarchaeota archaeon]|nr:hypothetical protein [Candidatus Aenigmarchaeota archaeon]